MDDYHMQELKELMEEQETQLMIGGGCQGLGKMCPMYRQHDFHEWSPDSSRRSKLDELPSVLTFVVVRVFV